MGCLLRRRPGTPGHCHESPDASEMELVPPRVARGKRMRLGTGSVRFSQPGRTRVHPQRKRAGPAPIHDFLFKPIEELRSRSELALTLCRDRHLSLGDGDTLSLGVGAVKDRGEGLSW